MNRIHVRCKTEIDYHRLKSCLEAEQIPHHGRELDSKIFPTGAFEGCFGEITVVSERHDQVQKLIQALGPESYSVITETITAQGSPKKVRSYKVFAWTMTATTLIASVLAFKYWDQSQQGINPNFTWEWGWDNSKYHLMDKKTGVLVNTFLDANWNDNPELIYSYWPDGSVSSILTDKDENGYYELTEAFAKDGKKSNMEVDLDGDGDYDYSETYLDNNEVIRFTDSDKNGRWEIASKPIK